MLAYRLSTAVARFPLLNSPLVTIVFPTGCISLIAKSTADGSRGTRRASGVLISAPVPLNNVEFHCVLKAGFHYILLELEGARKWRIRAENLICGQDPSKRFGWPSPFPA
jgi:hypothetical protein